jgi:ornithine decarboxylase
LIDKFNHFIVDLGPILLSNQIMGSTKISLLLVACILHITKLESHSMENTMCDIDVGKRLVLETIKRRVMHFDGKKHAYGEDNPFFVVDLGRIYQQHQQWRRVLPRIEPYYAVKCNADTPLLRLLRDLKVKFDCASWAEIQAILDIGRASEISYGHPCKARGALRAAYEAGVRRMTFDNADELYKIKEIAPDAELHLRIWTAHAGKESHLSQKFGAKLDDVPGLLEVAKNLGLRVDGIAFHVGTNTSDPSAYTSAVEHAAVAFRQATQLGLHLHTLNVGGGFVPNSFEITGRELHRAIQQHFPRNIKIIAEPGRFFVAGAYTLVCNVIGKRSSSREVSSSMGDSGDLPRLYLNDGVFGNFANVVWESLEVCPGLITVGTERCSVIDASQEEAKERGAGGMVCYSLWGPTCDGADKISGRWSCWEDIQVGDWLYFENLGAYSACCRTRFNGFGDMSPTEYVSSEDCVVVAENDSLHVRQ